MDGKSFGNGSDAPRDVKAPATGGVKRGHQDEVVVCGIRRLSTISERDADMDAPSTPSPSLSPSPSPSPSPPPSPQMCVGVTRTEWAGSSATLLSDKHLLSSGFTSFDSTMPDTGDDCASLLLACLHCRFSELLGLLPVTCGHALVRCCPSCRYFSSISEPPRSDADCCNVKINCDCGLFNSCQEASELLELAMEISEVCYR